MIVRSPTKLLAVLVGLLALIVGIWWGGHPSDLPGFLRSGLTSTSRYGGVAEALEDIQHDYFRPLQQSQLTDSSIAGAIAGLHDPYASYYSPKEYREFTNPPPQQFSGIGVDVRGAPAGLLIVDVLHGSPASKAGLRIDDVIIAAGGRRLAGFSSTRASALIRGTAGSSIALGIRRGSRVLSVTVTREEIATPLVTGSLQRSRGHEVGIIELPTFDVVGIHGEVAQTLIDLRRRGARAIVLDLRDNGGGLVSEAQLVASLFLSHGVIVTTRGRAQPTVTLRATGNPIAPHMPLAVLVDGFTASAAEIVTGALSDDHRAVIVGTHTYGKGVYQEIRPLSDGGAIDITVGEYFLPDGTNLGAGGLRRGHGITPDVVVNAPVTASSDPALETAVALVAAKVR